MYLALQSTHIEVPYTVRFGIAATDLGTLDVESSSSHRCSKIRSLTRYCQSLHRWGFAGYDVPFLEGRAEGPVRRGQ